MQHSVFQEIVDRTARKVRTDAVTAGLGVLVLAGVLSLGVAIICDMAISLPVSGRVFFAVLFWGLLVAVGILLVIWPMARSLPAMRVAAWIEKTIPNLHNRLISTLDLAKEPDPGRVNQAFLQRLVEETSAHLAGFRVEQVADPRPVRRLLAAAAGAFIVGAALVAAFQPRTTIAIARIFHPTAAILPPSWIQLQAVTGNIKVLKGDPLTVKARVLRGKPESLELRLRESGGQWVTYPMETAGSDEFAFTLGSVESSYEYQVLGPRTWTDMHHIQMLYRPVVESIAASVKLPAYTKIAAPQPVKEDAPQIEALLGSVVQLSVKVRRDASRGEVQLLEGVKKEESETLEQETIWFDDELPENVQPIGEWRWSPKISHSGLRSHTFNVDESVYGFTTKLNPLEIKPGESIIFYLRIDPEDPPTELSVGLWAKGKWFSAWSQFVWGPKPKEDQQKTKKRRYYVGPLPEPGRWTRMQVPINRPGPLQRMLERDQKAVVNGLKFERNGGNAFFDRIAIHTRTKVTTERIEFHQVNAYPLRQTQPGLWQCEVPVKEGRQSADLRLIVDLENALGHHNARVKPILLKPISDKAPTLIIDGPKDELVLANALPIPIAGQAFDDFGVAAIGFQVGTEPEEEALGEPQWVQTFDQPERARAIKYALKTHRSGLRRDTPIFYRLLARDHKGQVEATSLRQVELYAAELPELAPLVDQAAELPAAHRQVVAALGTLRQSVTDGQAKTWSKGAGHAGIALAAEQWEQWGKAHKDEFSAEQTASVKQLAEKLFARNEGTRVLDSTLRRGGIFAIHLDLALPFKSALFRIISLQLDALMLELPSQHPSHRDIRLRLAAMEELAGQQTPQFQRLLVQLSEFHRLDAAWEASPWPPDDLKQKAETLLTKAWGVYLLQEIGMVQRHLATHRPRVERAEQQLAKLIARAETATPEQAAALQREHEALLPPPRQELEQISNLLRPFMTPEERLVKLPGPRPPSAEDGEAAADESLAQHQQALRGLFASRREELLHVMLVTDRLGAELHEILDSWDQVGPEQVERIKQILRSDDVRLLLKVADLVLVDLYPQFAQKKDREKLRESTMADLEGKGKAGPADGRGKDGKGKQRLLPKDILRRLLEGETLKGPPAYQELINAYFKGLGQQSAEEAAE